MSINSMADEAVHVRQREVASKREDGGGAGLEKTGMPVPKSAGGIDAEGVADALKKVVTYIPSEIVGAYLIVVGLLASADSGVLWAIYFVFLILTPLAVLAAVAAKAKAKGLSASSQSSRWPAWAMIAASITFAAWAAALPGSVFNNLAWYSPAIGSVSVILAALVVGILSPVVGDK